MAMAGSHQTSAVHGAALQDPRFSIRPLVVGDRDGLAALFGRLSPESRRLRFLSPKPRLTARELTYLTDVDHIRHEALAAVDADDGSIVGVARYVGVANRLGVADVAIEVADDMQRTGIGLTLARAVVLRAQENGITVLTATTLWENRVARALAHRLGFVARASSGVEIELELELGSPPSAVLL